MEVACLARILERAKRWHLIQTISKLFPNAVISGRVLTPDRKPCFRVEPPVKNWKPCAVAIAKYFKFHP